MRKPVIALVVLSIAAASCSSEPEELSGFVRSPLPSVVGIVLPDVSEGGAPFEMRAPEGELLLVYFGYTACPDVCPTTLADLKKAFKELGDDADKITLAMATIDIERDVDDLITAYVQSFIPEAHALRAADDDTLRTAADAFGADYGVTVSDDGVYDVIHTAHTYAVNDQGQILVTWAFGTEAEVIASDIELLLKET
ncbi:MAG: SCO family protein [bacterium]|nr:SCO family protein [bacterium]